MSDATTTRLADLRDCLTDAVGWADGEGETLLAARVAEALDCVVSRIQNGGVSSPMTR